MRQGSVRPPSGLMQMRRQTARMRSAPRRRQVERNPSQSVGSRMHSAKNRLPSGATQYHPVCARPRLAHDPTQPGRTRPPSVLMHKRRPRMPLHWAAVKLPQPLRGHRERNPLPSAVAQLPNRVRSRLVMKPSPSAMAQTQMAAIPLRSAGTEQRQTESARRPLARALSYQPMTALPSDSPLMRQQTARLQEV